MRRPAQRVRTARTAAVRRTGCTAGTRDGSRTPPSVAPAWGSNCCYVCHVRFAQRRKNPSGIRAQDVPQQHPSPPCAVEGEHARPRRHPRRRPCIPGAAPLGARLRARAAAAARELTEPIHRSPAADLIRTGTSCARIGYPRPPSPRHRALRLPGSGQDPTLLNHVLNNRAGLRVAVIVTDARTSSSVSPDSWNRPLPGRHGPPLCGRAVTTTPDRTPTPPRRRAPAKAAWARGTPLPTLLDLDVGRSGDKRRLRPDG